MSIQAFERDPFQREIDTTILEVGRDEAGHWAITADTIFYPEGGGQPSDAGTVNGHRVVAVETVAGRIRHRMERPVELGPAQMVLDWARRWDHMQQHTAQHLLTAVAADRFAWRTTAFHLGNRISDVELDAPTLSPENLSSLEDAIAVEILNSRPISARRVSREEYDSLPVRSRGLPAGFSGDIRLVEIDDLDLNTCGGTHLRSTSDIGVLCLLGSEKLRGGTRVLFAAGDRARLRLRRHEERFRNLRSVLDAPTEGLVAEAERRAAQLKETTRTVKKLTSSLAEAESRVLAAHEGPVIEAHWPERDGSFLQVIARDLLKRRTDLVALLSAGEGDGAFIVLAGASTRVDLASVGPAVARIIGGKGGGRGKIFQGKATDLERRPEAAEFLKKSLATP